ncbi:hypothetical protein AN286_10385 (plasmid) [Aliarcobacter cryaerophilus ATCC 43158]|uniref:Uncharacterized protein n=1 Tax=Aliarcobacter cryaerophilus ATCC 43158 TaxID=1032070 RepID=A0AAD0XA10_9BACT|nr:hypothetical protein [Aliarcobacter cryaerophilus]AYJ81204.1 hypothetical protein ACRYA_a0079 [Aliarcobacter cryaerophilus ATCC 43158]QCZ24865.1 hypothetical protein AN286_10385 [Aliarcobacter cryaerophilus ATCC 43158]
MNRINPLYVVVLSIVLVIISFIYLSNEKVFYNTKVEQLNELEIKFKEYYEVSTYWKNEKYVKETIDHILSSSSFSNENINKVVTKEHIKLKLESSSEQTLDTFLNMILNKQLIINKLELKRDSIYLEVGLR